MKEPLYFVTVKYKLTLTFVLISVISLGIGGLVSYRITQDGPPFYPVTPESPSLQIGDESR